MTTVRMRLTGEGKSILADDLIPNDQSKILLDKLQPIIYDEKGTAYLRFRRKKEESH